MASANTFTLRNAARLLGRGGIIAHPTEGVYGLACDPYNRAAIARLLAIKARTPDKGVLLIASHWSQLAPLCAPLNEKTERRLRDAWPGPTTFILDAATGIDRLLTGGRDSLAVRVTDHPLSRALCDACDGPLVSTSANMSGRPAPRSALGVRLQLGNRIDGMLSGPLGGRSKPTAIIDARDGRVIRPA